MNEQINEILQRYFDGAGIVKVEGFDTIYRCVKTFDEVIYQVIYVDASGLINQNGFEVSSYLEKILLNDYYSNEGFLQWNFYYYFIVPEKTKRHDERFSDIEKDTGYARKFVFTPTELENWFRIMSEINLSSNAIELDLVTIWTNYLNENMLQVVYNKDYFFVDGVKSILNGDYKNIESLEPNFPATLSPRIQAIERFELRKFRERPGLNKYNFKKFNLINGANATGKTSILSAIEILLTGKSHKNQGENSFEIFATCSEGELKFPLRDNKIYKGRDKSWYNSGLTRGESLNSNFVRYNYFTADAAYEMEFRGKNGEGELLNTLENISLGNEVNQLETRIDKYIVDIEAAIGQLSAVRKASNTTILRLKGELKRIKDVLEKQTDHYAVFLEGLLEQGYKTRFAELRTQNNFLLVEVEMMDAKGMLAYLKSEPIMKLPNRNAVIVEINRLEKLQGQHENLARRYSEIVSDVQSTESLIKERNSFKAKLDRFILYRSIPNVENVLISDSALEQLVFNNKQYGEIVDLIHQLILGDLPSGITFTLSQLLEDIDIKINESKEDVNRIEEQVREFEAAINESEKLLTDIKALGNRYIHNDPEACNCPLCHSVFPPGELPKQIVKSFTAIRDSGLLQSTKTKLREFQNNVDKMIGQRANLSTLRQIFGLLDMKTDVEIDAERLNSIIKEVLSSFEQTTVQLSRISDFNRTYGSYLLSVEEFVALQNQIPENNNFESLKKKLENEIVSINEAKISLEECRLKRELISNEMTELLSTAGVNIVELQKQLNSILQARQYYDEISNFIEFKDSDDVSLIENRVDKILNLTYLCNEAIKNYDADTIAEKSLQEKIDEIEDEMPRLDSQLENGNNALVKLKLLQQNHGKRKYMQSYITNNKVEIYNIFRMIHAPKEFSGMEITNESIRLVRQKNGEQAKLSEISSGQRAALALSIFLSLNRKLTNGPDLILFDDPITLVDDLNVLSFIDYLRELVIQSGKQVFFATANNDLAFIIKKKFDFLDKELEVIKLSHEIFQEEENATN